MRTLTAVLLLLALASTGFAAYGDPEAPTRFLRVELLDAGAMAMPPAVHARLLRVDLELNRWRVGVSAFDQGLAFGGGDPYENTFGGYAVPDVGYRLYQRPRRTAFFHGMVPSVWVEAAGTLPIYPLMFYPAARINCRAEVDYYGAGIAVEAGVNGGFTESSSWFISPYARAGVILGVANFGF